MKHVFKQSFALLLSTLLLLSCFGVGALAAGKKAISKCSVSVTSAVVYTGKAKKPAVTVTDGSNGLSKVLKKGTDYTLTYKNNKKIGVASVTVTAKKNSAYTGAKTVKFKIVPAAPKNLSAAKTTANAVKLTWSAVQGATGYAVYSYDKAAGTYTRVKSAAKTSATVKNLAASTRYYFAVRAYAKVNGKTFWSADSKLLKVKTAAAASAGKAYRLENYKKILKSGTYLISFTASDPTLGDVPLTFATKNGNVMVKTKISSMNVRLLHLAAKNKDYMLIDDLGIYSELTPELLGDESLDLSETAQTLVGSIDTTGLTAGTVKRGGKTYNCESRTNPDGTVSRYLFNGDTLVRMETVNADGSVDTTVITELTGNVPDSTFQIPKKYSYIDLNWLMQMAG